MVNVLLRLDQGGYSELERACMTVDPETVTSLLTQVDTDDPQVYPALIVAAALSPQSIQSILAPIIRSHPNATDHHGRTAVTVACARDMEHVVRRLTAKARYLRCSADLWRDPFLTACTMGSASLILYLADKFKGVVDQKDSRKRTPLHFLCTRGMLGPRWGFENSELYRGIDKVIATVLDRGADVNAKDAHQRTPLHILCDTASRQVGPVVGLLADMACVLLDRGADIAAIDQKGNTPFKLCKNFSLFNYLRVGPPRLDPNLAKRMNPLTSSESEADPNLLQNATLPFLTWPNAHDPLLAHVLTLPKVIKSPHEALTIISATYPTLVYNCIQHVRLSSTHGKDNPCAVRGRPLQCLLHLWLVYHPIRANSRLYPFNMPDTEIPFPSLRTLAVANVRQRLPQRPLYEIEEGLLLSLPKHLVNLVTLRYVNEKHFQALFTKLFG